MKNDKNLKSFNSENFKKWVIFLNDQNDEIINNLINSKIQQIEFFKNERNIKDDSAIILGLKDEIEFLKTNKNDCLDFLLNFDKKKHQNLIKTIWKQQEWHLSNKFNLKNIKNSCLNQLYLFQTKQLNNADNFIKKVNYNFADWLNNFNLGY